MLGYGCGLGLFCRFFAFCLFLCCCSQVCGNLVGFWDGFSQQCNHCCILPWGFDSEPSSIGTGIDEMCLSHFTLGFWVSQIFHIGEKQVQDVQKGCVSGLSNTLVFFLCMVFTIAVFQVLSEVSCLGSNISVQSVCLGAVLFIVKASHQAWISGQLHQCMFVALSRRICLQKLAYQIRLFSWRSLGFILTAVSSLCNFVRPCARRPIQAGSVVASIDFDRIRKHNGGCSLIPVRCHTFLRVLLLIALRCRLGEAAVPGPSPSTFTMGVCNPGGLATKAHLLDAQVADMWLISETHLTVEGLRSFRKQLAFLKSPLKWVSHGSPVLTRSQSSDVGQWSGVACVSSSPTRLLTPSWDHAIHNTSRIVCSTTFCSQVWITGVTVYGTPVGPTHPHARKTTNTLLDEAIKRVLQSTGCRFVAGDWNGDVSNLAAITKLRRLGFQDVQDLEFSRTGRSPVATCRGKTRRDYLFVSPELARRFISCDIDPLAWTDHAAIRASFQGSEGNHIRSLWPIPGPLNWQLAPIDEADVVVDFQAPNELDETYCQFWSQKESRVCQGAKLRGGIVPPCALGRGVRTQPKLSNAPNPPVKMGRAGDLRPAFHGFSMLHLQWFRQLRRLQHYVRLAKVDSPVNSHHSHQNALWSSILQGSGFKPNFAAWWTDQVHPHCTVLAIPVLPPSGGEAEQIFCAFEIDVRELERQLGKHRNYATKLKRTSDINELYKVVRRDMPEQVDVLINETKGLVDHVDSEFQAVEFHTPVSWNAELPIFHQGHELNVIHQEPDKLWLDDTQNFSVGDAVVQPSQVGNIDVLFEAFREQWNQRWNKHTGVPADRWRIIMDFAVEALPRKQIDHLSCDAALLRATVQSKKRNAATGLDGVSRADLLACSHAELQCLTNIFVRAEATGEWPTQVLKGAVKSLAKVPSPSRTSHFRPITVFGMLYRSWSSAQSRYLLSQLDDRLHPLLLGNRSNRRAADLWRVILDAVEGGHIHSNPTTGLVFDLEKAYNTLPRLPTLQAVAILGVPNAVLQAWAAALADIERFFVIQGQYSKGLFSNCGFAEGCGLSCLAMVAIDELYHQWLIRANIGAQPLSFVDNWEILLQDPARAEGAFTKAMDFAAALDLRIDVAKTYAWSTNSEARCLLRSQRFKVLGNERDLGAHVVYTKQIRNATIQTRIQGLADFWNKLKLAGGTHIQRLRLIKTAAWPRALHGISGSFLGRKHWESLRSECLKSMNLAKAGVNPPLQFLIEGWTLDPQAFAIVATLRDFRDLGSTDAHLHTLWEATQGFVDLPFGSVSSILTSRIETLGWKWIGEGIIQDAFGACDVANCGMTELLLRAQLGWNQWVAGQVAHRTSFQQFAQVDVLTTVSHVNSLSPLEQATIRSYLNGMTFTNAQACLWTNSGSSNCQACGAPDSTKHRLYECPFSEQCRSALATEVLDAIIQAPPVLSLHGWTLQASAFPTWMAYLVDLQVQCVEPGVFPQQQFLDLFTDGSCCHQHPYCTAAWAVVQAQGPNVDASPEQFDVVAAGPVPGCIQSAHRAELHAVLHALQFARKFAGVIRLWSDCESVVTKFRLYVQGSKPLKKSARHFDVWQQILDTIPDDGCNRILIAKVPSHQSLDSAADDVERWVYMGNSIADRVACAANRARPQWVWDLWAEFRQQHCQLKYIGEQVRQLMLQVSFLWRSNRTSELNLVASSNRPVREGRVFQQRWRSPGIIHSVSGVWHRRFHTMEQVFLQWWNNNVNHNGDIVWVSFVQLYLDWMMATKHMGVLNLAQTWIDTGASPGRTPEQYRFRTRAKWWRLCLQQFFKDADIDVATRTCRPQSRVLHVFLGSASLPWPSHRLEAVDSWLVKQCGSVHGNGQVLDTLPFPTSSGLDPL